MLSNVHKANKLEQAGEFRQKGNFGQNFKRGHDTIVVMNTSPEQSSLVPVGVSHVETDTVCLVKLSVSQTLSI
jgi:hypothetical protein